MPSFIARIRRRISIFDRHPSSAATQTATNSMRVPFCQSLFLALQRLLAEPETTLTAETRGAAGSNRKLLLAVSGGADSVALLRGCHQLAAAAALDLRVIHVDHRLRTESADDARWVADLCKTLSIPCEIHAIGVRELAGYRQIGIEEAARYARYAVFQQVAQEHDIRFVATAHTADDQAETVLNHVIRGTGLSGLSGIPESRPIQGGQVQGCHLIRPMLRTSRADVIAYLHDIQQTYREDRTNSDETITRNRIRRSLIPLLREEYNTQVRSALVRLAHAAAEAQELVDTLAEELFRSSLVEQSATECRLNVAPIAASAPVVIKAMMLHVWKTQAWPRQSLSADHLDAVVELIQRYRRHGSAAANARRHDGDERPEIAAHEPSSHLAEAASNRRPRFRTSLPGGLQARISRRQLIFEIVPV